MIECLNNLVNIKELCTEADPQPLFWLNDAEGIDRESLAQLAKPSNGSGKAFGEDIIETSARLLMADIETLIPKGYSIKSFLNSFCNTCTYTGVTSGTAFTGIIVKNISTSKNSYLSIDSLKIMIQSTGTFSVILDDGVLSKQIVHDFTAGTEVILTNINYKTAQTSVKIYFLDAGVLVNALNCPTSKSCGCSGSSAQSTDISVKGLLGNVEFTTQYGFVPCASIVCSLDNIICNIVNQQPRLFALAMFYRTTSRVYAESLVTQRNNLMASFSKEQKEELADRYLALYYERLRGSENVKGIADNMASALNNLNDSCVECKRMSTVAWATG